MIFRNVLENRSGFFNLEKEGDVSVEPNLQPFGKLLIVIGVIIVVFGVILLFAGKIPFIGKLPGDIYIKKDNFSVYIPIATSILLSIILSVIAYFLRK